METPTKMETPSKMMPIGVKHIPQKWYDWFRAQNSWNPWELLESITNSCDSIIHSGENDAHAVDELRKNLTELLSIMEDSSDINQLAQLKEEINGASKDLFRGNNSVFKNLITSFDNDNDNKIKGIISTFLANPLNISNTHQISAFFNFNREQLEIKLDESQWEFNVGYILEGLKDFQYIYNIEASNMSPNVNIRRSPLQRTVIEPYEIKHDFGGSRGKDVIDRYISQIIEIDKVCILIDLINQTNDVDLATVVENLWTKPLNEHNATVGISKCLNNLGKLSIGPGGKLGNAIIGPYTGTNTDIAIQGIPQYFLEKLFIPNERMRCIADVYGTAPSMLGPFYFNLEDHKGGSTRLFAKYDGGEMSVTTVETRNRHLEEIKGIQEAEIWRSSNEHLDTEITTIRFYNGSLNDNYGMVVAKQVNGDTGPKLLYTVTFPSSKLTLRERSFSYEIDGFSVTNVCNMVVYAIGWCREILTPVESIKTKVRDNDSTLKWILSNVQDLLQILQSGGGEINTEMEIALECACLITNAIGFKQTCDIGIYPVMTICACGNELISKAHKYNYTALPIVRSMCIDSDFKDSKETLDASSGEKEAINDKKEKMCQYIFARLLSNVDLRIPSIIEITGDYIGSALSLNTYTYQWIDPNTHKEYDLSRFFLSEGFFHGNKSDNICSMSSLSDLIFGMIYLFESDDQVFINNYAELFSAIKKLSIKEWGDPSLAEICFNQDLCVSFIRTIMRNLHALSSDFVVSHTVDYMAELCFNSFYSNSLPEQLVKPVDTYYKCAEAIYELNKVLVFMSKQSTLQPFVEYLNSCAAYQSDYYDIYNNNNLPLYSYIALEINILLTPNENLPSFLQIPKSVEYVFADFTYTDENYFGFTPSDAQKEGPSAFDSTSMKDPQPASPSAFNAVVPSVLTLETPKKNDFWVGRKDRSPTSNKDRSKSRSRDKKSDDLSRFHSRGTSPRGNSPRGNPPRGGYHNKKTSIKKNKRNNVRASRKQKKASKVATKSWTVKHRKHKG